MPSIEPGALTYDGGALRTARIVPARLSFAAGGFIGEVGTPTTAAAATPELDNWTRTDRPASISESDWVRWMARDQRFTDAIEAAFRAVNQRIDEVAIMARLNRVETLAQAANDTATQAQVVVEQTSTAVQETFQQIDPTYADYYEGRREIDYR